MKILVIGGTHGNEPLGPQLVASLNKDPIPGVDTLIGNPRAVRRDCRFVEKDLNRSFPGSSSSAIYEERRAAKIRQACRSYDVVLDFHNTLANDNDCVFIGQNAKPQLQQVASYLGLQRVIVADYDCINKYVPTCISLEISVTSRRMSVALWQSALAKLARLQRLPQAKDLRFYRYALTVTTDQAAATALDAQDIGAFQPVPDTIASALGAASPAYGIFVGKNYSEGVYAGLLNEL
jgi:hypothetical protein